jgi:two-component system response regulator NreC
MITILVVDDHSIVRQGMISMLTDAHPDWNVVEAENGVQAVLTALKVKPDLVVMDYMMPKLDGIKAASAITRDLPDSKIIMVTMSDRDELLPGATEAGVKRLIAKDAPPEEILGNITDLLEEVSKSKEKTGQKIIQTSPYKSENKLFPQRRSSSLMLTDREIEVLDLLGKGYTVNRIAEHLGISKRTAETHVYKILKKFHLHSTSELIRLYLSKKLSTVL